MCFVNAAGGTIPPIYIFPLNKVNPLSMVGAVPGAIAFTNGSGWMDGNVMSMAMDHMQAHVKSTKEDPVFWIWDNASPHLDFRVVKKAMEYNMEILTFPPHTSHELQPLDVTCYGPMKRGTQTHEMVWYRRNPGKRITIHHLAAITREPFLNAMTPSNIISGFKKS